LILLTRKVTKNADPARHIGFSSVAPITGRDGLALRDLVRDELGADGLDYSGVIIASRCFMIHVCLVVFDTKNESQAPAPPTRPARASSSRPPGSAMANIARTWISWTSSRNSMISTTTRCYA
jgi:hypothetical protein